MEDIKTINNCKHIAAIYADAVENNLKLIAVHESSDKTDIPKQNSSSGRYSCRFCPDCGSGITRNEQWQF